MRADHAVGLVVLGLIMLNFWTPSEGRAQLPAPSDREVPASKPEPQTQPFRVVNASAAPAIALHAVRSGRPDWGGNLLNRGPLPPNATFALRPSERAGCRFDLRLVLENGQEVIQRGIDVCVSVTIRLAPGLGAAAVSPTVPGTGTGVGVQQHSGRAAAAQRQEAQPPRRVEQNAARVLLFRNYYHGQPRSEFSRLPGARSDGDNLFIEDRFLDRNCKIYFVFNRDALERVEVEFAMGAASGPYTETVEALSQGGFMPVWARSGDQEVDFFSERIAGRSFAEEMLRVETLGLERGSLIVLWIPAPMIIRLIPPRAQVNSAQIALLHLARNERIAELIISSEDDTIRIQFYSPPAIRASATGIARDRF